MSLILSEVKTPNQYDRLRLYDVAYPKFRIPLHSTFDGLKIIPEFDINFLSKNGFMDLMKTDHFYDIVFLKNFGKCTVLKGLKDSSREYNILCILQDTNVFWLYLTNEEYANFLLKYNENEFVENANKIYNPFTVGKIYKIKNSLGLNLYKHYKISISKYEMSDHYYHKTIIGIDRLDALKENDEFLVLEQKNVLENIDLLEQQDASFTGRYSAIADNLYYILGIGKEFLGYAPVSYSRQSEFEEIIIDQTSVQG